MSQYFIRSSCDQNQQTYLCIEASLQSSETLSRVPFMAFSFIQRKFGGPKECMTEEGITVVRDVASVQCNLTLLWHLLPWSATYKCESKSNKWILHWEFIRLLGILENIWTLMCSQGLINAWILYKVLENAWNYDLFHNKYLSNSIFNLLDWKIKLFQSKETVAVLVVLFSFSCEMFNECVN